MYRLLVFPYECVTILTLCNKLRYFANSDLCWKIAVRFWTKPVDFLVQIEKKHKLLVFRFLRWFLSIALRILTAHDFRVISARKLARARTDNERNFPQA